MDRLTRYFLINLAVVGSTMSLAWFGGSKNYEHPNGKCHEVRTALPARLEER